MAYQLKSDDWSVIWDAHLKRYVYSEPKRAKMIQELIEKLGVEVKTIIELGCGSLRDGGFLSQKFEVIGLDFNKKVLVETKNIHSECNRMIASATALPLKDKSVDLSFSSGLLIYFNNEDALKIIKEQVRITKSLALIFVHNKTNIWEIPTVKIRSVKDKLFRFRRFSKKELFKLLSEYRKSVKIIPFGTTHPFYLLSWNRHAYSPLKKLGFDKKLKKLHCTTEWCAIIDLHK
jgi:ubiquinone/menaquinone biosynthesis C-methylase UbiE